MSKSIIKNMSFDFFREFGQERAINNTPFNYILSSRNKTVHQYFYKKAMNKNVEKCPVECDDGHTIDAGIGDPYYVTNKLKSQNLEQRPSNIRYYFNNIVTEKPNEYQTLVKNYIIDIQKHRLPSTCKILLSNGGSTILVAAFYYAVSKMLDRQITIKSSLAPPYYALHKQIAKITKNCLWNNSDKSSSDIVVIVSPNNPDGRVTDINDVTNISRYILLDSAYDKPQYTNQTTVNSWKFDLYGNKNFCEINSFSKNGLPGTRIGYAIISDDKIYELMDYYLRTMSLGLNLWSLNNLKLNLSSSLSDVTFYKSIYVELQRRYKEITQIIPKSKIITSNYNTMFVYCSIPYKFFLNINTIVLSGTYFGETDDYSRINICLSSSEWKTFINRLKRLFGKMQY